MESEQPHPTRGQSTSTRANIDQSGFIGELSLMSSSSSSSVPVSMISDSGSFPAEISHEILKLTNATCLPPSSKIKVFTDTYFMHLYHIAPIIDRSDMAVANPSILLLQAMCLIGSQLRYPRDQSPTLMSESYYLKIKTLIFTKYESDHFAILKTLCILCFWIITPPVVVSLDASYHWLGVAVRLAYQIGLHRQSSYSKLSNPGAARRIMWFLFVSSIVISVGYSNFSQSADKLQAAAFGRPIFLASQGIDLLPLEHEDFESADTKAEIFIQFTKLNMLLERIVECQDRKAEISHEQVRAITPGQSSK